MVNGLKEFTWFTAYLELISIEKNSIGFDLSYYTIYLVENARLLRKFKANMKIFFQNQIGVKFFPGFRGKAFK